MDLSPDVLNGFASLSDKVRISDKHFIVLLKAAAESLVGRYSGDLLKGVNIADESNVKSVFASLSTVLLEAAKHDKDTSSLSQVLDECKCDADRCKLITSVYEQYKDEVRAVLACTGSDRRHIVDVDWRLDYHIKDNQLERVGQPVYLIDIKTEQTLSGPEDVQFACTRDQLQDLVSKLRDACKSLERTSQT
jgi:polycomb group RING finger protein 4